MQHKRALTIAIATPVGCAVVGNTLTGNAATQWYPTLRKSRLILPLWMFLPIGIAYYGMCGVLLYRLLMRVTPSRQQTTAIALLLAMMSANEGWNYLFFGKKDLRLSFFGLLGFIVLTIALYRLVRQIDRRSAAILLPYVIWLGYDVVWAEELWRLNTEAATYERQ